MRKEALKVHKVVKFVDTDCKPVQGNKVMCCQETMKQVCWDKYLISIRKC